MNVAQAVAESPFFTTNRNVLMLSAVVSAWSYRRSISCWPGATSMCGFDVEAHGLEREHDLAPHVLAPDRRDQVEVAGSVVRFSGGPGRLAPGRGRTRPGPAFIWSPRASAIAITRLSVVRGQPTNGVPSGE